MMLHHHGGNQISMSPAEQSTGSFFSHLAGHILLQASRPPGQGEHQCHCRNVQMSAAACRRWPQQTKDNNISHLSVSPIDIPSLHEVLLLDVSKLMLLCPVFKVYNSRKPFIVLDLVLSNICFARENPQAYIGSWWAQRSEVCRNRVTLLPSTDQCR